jgi:GNAT superfamily N-acetyltransferase
VRRIRAVEEILEAFQRTKANAPAFRTNFFPVKEKLLDAVRRGRWAVVSADGTVFFLRRDRDFHHLYFSAASLAALQSALPTLAESKTIPMILDLVGEDAAAKELSTVFESAGFRTRARLMRLARMTQAVPAGSAATDRRVVLAEEHDTRSVQDLLMRSFDRYADQIPDRREIAMAALNRQVLMISDGAKPAAILYFEPRGMTSTVRYWLVDRPYRAMGYGSVLMRHYFALQCGARRFILWVRADNEDAIHKYRHYGYAPDGLSDLILMNSLIGPRAAPPPIRGI